MKKVVIAGLGMIAASMLATSAQADTRWPNWYIGLHGGVNFYPDSDVTAGAVGGDLRTDTGYMVGASLGYMPSVDMLSAMRFELEYTRRSNDNNRVDGLNSIGQTESDSYMLNAYLDLDNETIFTPYLGLGVGFSSVSTASGTNTTIDDTAFAYQLMAGIMWEPETMPMTQWGFGYRYLGTNNLEMTAPTTPPLPVTLDYSSHAVEGNVKFKF